MSNNIVDHDPTGRSNLPSRHPEPRSASPPLQPFKFDQKARRLSALFHMSTPHFPSRKLRKSIATQNPRTQRQTSENSDGTHATEDRPWTGSSSITRVPPQECDSSGANTPRHSYNSRQSRTLSGDDASEIGLGAIPVPELTFSPSSTTSILHQPARHSSLRFESRLSRAAPRHSLAPCANMETSSKSDAAEPKVKRPRSHPPISSGQDLFKAFESGATSSRATPHPGSMATAGHHSWQVPPLPQHSVSRSSSRKSAVMPLKPKASFTRLQSLDSLITYREEKAEWKRASSFVQSTLAGEEDPYQQHSGHLDSRAPTREHTIRSEADTIAGAEPSIDEKPSAPPSPTRSSMNEDERHAAATADKDQPKNKFRTFAAEVGFCFTIAMTQFLAEYMISGFAIELPKIMSHYAAEDADPGSMGMFWPASLLSLILSATLLIFARISDMYGGYLPFMFGVIWLGIWSLLAGFAKASVLLDVSRAMQGLAVAAYIPSTFAIVGSIYPEGPRKNLVLGLYAGCAPLGFFAGFLAAGALPDSAPGWYFWIAAILSCITAVTAYLTIPHDRTDRKQLSLKMDWIGAFLITTGLILVAYALAVEPYAAHNDNGQSGWLTSIVLAPLLAGVSCLGLAFWIEGWYAACPLLPFDFFSPKSVKAFSLACLCFYASYGVWLYESAQYFSNSTATGMPDGVRGLTLAAWYTPTAIGGLVLCVVGGALMHRVPIMLLLIVSGIAWIGAPLLLAMAPLPVHYWSFVMPSMLCATIGIDLTFTISVVYLSAVSPLRYQGLAGAVSSILVNLAMSFSLSISEIVAVKAESGVAIPEHASTTEQLALADQKAIRGFRDAFIYAAASAVLGLLIAILFVRISRSIVQTEKPLDLEGNKTRPSSEVSTLVDMSRQ